MLTRAPPFAWFWRSLRRAGWAPASVLTFFIVADTVFHGYARYPSLDIPTHLAGGLALAYFFHDAFGNMQETVGAIPHAIRLLLVFFCVCTAAVFWEFFEFLCDHLLGTTMQLGNDDTMSDLFFGLVGGTIFLVIHEVARYFRQARRTGALSASAREKMDD